MGNVEEYVAWKEIKKGQHLALNGFGYARHFDWNKDFSWDNLESINYIGIALNDAQARESVWAIV